MASKTRDEGYARLALQNQMSEPEIDPHETARALKKLQEDMDLVKKALMGDLSVSKDARGLITNHLMMMDDLYRNGSGLKNRVERLEEYKIRVAAWIAAGTIIAGGIWELFRNFITIKK